MAVAMPAVTAMDLLTRMMLLCNCGNSSGDHYAMPV
jgi:hypothetical protein